MGLLEKAQTKKNTDNQKQDKLKEEQSLGLLQKAIQKKQDKETKKVGLLQRAKEKKDDSPPENIGLLQKAQMSVEKKTTDLKKPTDQIKKKNLEELNKQENIEIIDEKTGFGWKGLATRRIVFDKDLNERIYRVSEPVLNSFELEKKNEMSRLFKMLADVNITNINDEEKERYLEETLNQIILDNNISFIKKEKEDSKTKGLSLDFLKKKKEPIQTDEKKSIKEMFSFKKKKEKIEPRILNQQEQESKDKIFYHLFRDFLGYGKIDIIMKDVGIEDISCDGHHVPIFIYHKKYSEITTNVMFDDEQDLNSFVVRLAQICGKQISIYSPIVDGKLPDGSRLQTTLARTVTKGSTFTIRKFKENPLTPIDMIDFQSISLDMAAYFWLAIENGASILFCGGTASGKTTALNALSLFIPPMHKIITIEDTREVNLPHKNWISGTTREGFSSSEAKTGKDIDMFDLIRAALRQRPKVVIVGEVRGKEAYSLFQAMATGHTSYATVHASDIHTLIQRLENPPISLPRALLTSLDVIVFQNAINIAGKTFRRMTSVTEIVKLDPDTNQLIFMEPFRWVSKTDDRFESSGGSKIMNNIRLQNDWTDSQLETELQNRKLILEWMQKKDMRSYLDVGKIVSDYCKYPDKLMKKVREEKNK